MEQGYKPVMYKNTKFKQFVEFVYEFVKIVILALAIVIPIRYFLIQPFYVKGASMEPNFHDHQYLIIDEISYRFNEPQRGDIVVFKYPRNTEQFFIKRVIGLPGEKVKLYNGNVYIQKKDSEDWLLLDESAYLSDNVNTYPNKIFDVPEGSYFVMGDNRNSSMDSRVFGPVERKYIIGKTWVRAWPFDKFTIFHEINYSIDK